MRSTLRSAAAALLLVAATAGCGDSRHGYSHHNGAGIPRPTGGTPVYRIYPGAGSAITTGTRPGYAIAANVGGSYRLVWTGDGYESGAYSEFYGSVYTPGHFVSRSAIMTEGGGYVSDPVPDSGGERVDFDTLAATRIDGFDFVVDTEPVYFDILIDGRRYPQLVYFPATDGNPPGVISNVGTIPFGLTTH